MKRLFLITISLLQLVFLSSTAQVFTYPPTQKIAVTDTIFSRVIIDNYRWMEDVNNERTKEWLKAQAEFTESMLKKIPGRDLLIKEFEKLDALNKEDMSRPDIG